MRLIFKDLPLRSHERARPAAEAARCAGAQGRYWPYHDRLFEEQPRFGRDDLIGYAADVGLDRAEFVRCLDGHTFAAAVEADVYEARDLGITSTPTFLVNGAVLVGAHPVETFRKVIDDELRRRRGEGRQ